MCHISSDVCVFFPPAMILSKHKLGSLEATQLDRGVTCSAGPVRLLDSALQRPAEAANTETELLKYSATSEGHRQTAESMEY